MTPVASISQRLLVSLLLLPLDVAANEFYRPHLPNYVHANCYAGDIYHLHRDVIVFPGNSHCLKHRCDDGSWVLHEEGCQYKGVCHPVGSSFDDNCMVLGCRKSSRNGRTTYTVVNFWTLCQDYNGTCRHSASRFSWMDVHGVLRHNCSCSFDGIGVRYWCHSQ